MIKYSDASNVEKTAGAKVSSSLPQKPCCVINVKTASTGYYVCDKCGNHLHKVEERVD
jgi:tRNA(Ile2) C34 agmatinyltransferase TiaS